MTLTNSDTGIRRLARLNPYTEHRRWGSIDLPDPMMVARTGIARYSLSVFAPGTSEVERHELRVAKRWWIGTAAVTLLGELVVLCAGVGLTTASGWPWPALQRAGTGWPARATSDEAPALCTSRS